MAATRIGHYTIVSELGRGGMGVVYKAHEESLNRFVAIKVLAEQLAAEPEFVTRFEREARAAAALSHPNIIQIHYIGEDQGRHFFVMEYVSGRSLLEITRQEGRIENPRAARLMLQAAQGLAAAHDVDMLHRDIKPANIMVDSRDFVKIADFGLALPLDTVTRLTATGMLMGTPGYLSPEQCMGEKLDRRTDIYSLGVTYYEVLSGQLPFRADSPLALLRKIVDEEPPDISSLNQGVDEATHRIVHRMIAKDREQRYPDCHELVGDLEEYLALFDRGRSRRTAGVAPAASVASQSPLEDAATERLVAAEPPRGGEASPVPAVAPTPPPPAAKAGTAEAPSPPSAPLPAPSSALVAPSPSGLVPAPTTAPEVAAPPRARGSRAALLAAGVLVVAVAALAGGGILLMRSSLVSRILSRGAGTPAGTQAATSPAEGDAGEATAAPATGGAAGARGVAAGAAATSPQHGGAALPPRDAGQPGEAAEPHRGASSAPAPPEQRRARSGTVAGAETRQAPRSGVAVAAVGEAELAGVVESVLSSELGSAGIEAQSAAALPETEELVRPGGVPRTADLLAALRPGPLAAVLVARVVPAGQRQLVYMGRSDVAYSSRVELTVYDLESGRPRGGTLSATVEYTNLTAEREVDKALGPLVRELAKRLR